MISQLGSSLVKQWNQRHFPMNFEKYSRKVHSQTFIFVSVKLLFHCNIFSVFLSFYYRWEDYMNLVYFTTRVPDTSSTSATRIRHGCDTNDKSETQMRNEQHECDTSALRTTRVRSECYTRQATRVWHQCDRSEKCWFW